MEEHKKIDENIFYKKREIEYISLDLLLTQIAVDEISEYNNFDIVKGFLLQFDAFIREEMLLKKIRSVFLYYVTVKKHFPRSLIIFCNQWIYLKWKEDFFEKIQMAKEMKAFYLEIQKFQEVNEDKDLKIKEIIELLEEDNEFDAEFLFFHLKNRKRRKNICEQIEMLQPMKSTEYFDILVWPEMEIARQISIYSHYYFSRIEVKEILSSRWTNKNN